MGSVYGIYLTPLGESTPTFVKRGIHDWYCRSFSIPDTSVSTVPVSTYQHMAGRGFRARLTGYGILVGQVQTQKDLSVITWALSETENSVLPAHSWGTL